MKEILLQTLIEGSESHIVIGRDIWKSELKKSLSRYRQAIVFTDSNVYALYGKQLKEVVGDTPVHVMKAGEEYKTHETLLSLLGSMAAASLHRSGCLVAFGGGVVGDIGGLSASLYMRGIACIQVPTTVLSQVDSSVGGKTAVDFAGVKNLVGAFYQPQTVIADSVFFKTLPQRELRCGLGEIVKHGALQSELFDTLWENQDKLFDLEFIGALIESNISFKAQIVAQDAKEAGLRKCLNLGHTTAHALELSDKKLSHGEYVLLGTIFEAEIAKAHGGDSRYLDGLKALCLSALEGMPPLPDLKEATRLALLDKKNVNSAEVVITAPYQKGEYKLISLPFEQYCEEIVAIGRKFFLKLAVVGKDVSQSLSPQMHAFILNRMGVACKYDKISFNPKAFAMRAEELFACYDAFNVTIPYKTEIMPYLKELLGDASTFGAVNTVLCRERAGYNTDGFGFLLMLQNAGVVVKGKSVLVLGCGGAGRSCIKKLCEAGATVFAYDKSFERVQAVYGEFGGFTPLETVPAQPFDIILNCTGVGMHDTVGKTPDIRMKEGELPVDGKLLSLCEAAVDLIYVPAQSEFLRIAKGLGKKTVNGEAMLFYQAYMADCIYLKINPDAAQAKAFWEQYKEENE